MEDDEDDYQKPINFKGIDKKQAELYAKEILERIEKGMNLQEAAKIPDDMLEEVYSLAYAYYNQGKSKEALALFQFLSLAVPKNHKYVYGFACALYQAKIYIQASMAFYMALEIKPDHPEACYYLADCFLQQNLLTEGLECLDFAIELCGNSKEHKQLKQKCLLIKSGLTAKKT